MIAKLVHPTHFSKEKNWQTLGILLSHLANTLQNAVIPLKLTLLTYLQSFLPMSTEKGEISFCSLWVYSYLCNRICVCGGIGRRARIRIWYLTMCRFDSCQTHKFTVDAVAIGIPLAKDLSCDEKSVKNNNNL